jgi:hypothetical protein
VGAGAQPLGEHRRRPPIPIVPVDDAARAAALARGADAERAWLAAVTGDAAIVAARVRFVDLGDVEVLRTTLAAHRDAPGMSVGEVALAVDTGRAIAARAAAEDVQVLSATAPDGHDDAAVHALAAALTGGGEHGPLGLLRRLGEATVGVLCGVALGAGEHGLAYAAGDLASLAGAAVAIGIEPDVRARVVALRTLADPESSALAAHLDVMVSQPRLEPSPGR